MSELAVVESEAPKREKHRCSWGHRCIDPDLREIDPETGEAIKRGAVIAFGVLCDACMTRLVKSVRGMPRDYGRLSDALGERMPDPSRLKVTMTLSPEMPINDRREGLMARIVELADRAAEMVECELQMTGKNRRRNDQPPISHRGFAAARGESPSETLIVARSTELLDSMIYVLLDVEPDWHMLWGPIPDADEEWDRYKHGQPRELVLMDGVDVALKIADLSTQIYRELGLSRLREKMKLACPAINPKTGKACGAYKVGRNDGTLIFDCLECERQFGKNEYDWFEGLHRENQKELALEIGKLSNDLYAANWRLDALRTRLTTLEHEDLSAIVQDAVETKNPDKAMELIGLIMSNLGEVLTMGAAPHLTPEERQKAIEAESKEAKRARR